MAQGADDSRTNAGRDAEPRHPQENEWVRAAKAGSREAFDALVELHGRAVLRYLEGMSGAGGDAEDLAQDVLLQAFRRLGTFTTGTDLRAWLLTIAYHAWVHAVRRKRVVTAHDQALLGSVPAAGTASDAGELGAAVRAGIAALPEDQRTVVLLRFGEGLSHAQIAAITGAEEPTVRWRLFRARRTLQKVLKAWAPVDRASAT